LPEVDSKLDVEFDLVWLDVNLRTEDTIRVAPASMRGLRSEMVTTLYDQNPTVDRGTIEERCVLMVTVDGPGYDVPDLTVIGPSKRAGGKDSEEESYAVNVVDLLLNKRADEHTPSDQYQEWLIDRIGALAEPGDEWKKAFNYSAETLSEARNRFRRKLRRELRKTMELFEETCGQANDDELSLLRQAASLLAYRTMFLRVLERRGRLYRSSVNPAPLGDQEVSRSLNDELAYRGDEVEEETIPGALLARLVHTVRAIRGDVEDKSVAITGASIFENRPANFDPKVGPWLDILEELVDEEADTSLLARWDEQIRKLGAIMLGHLDDEYREEVNLIGSGAHRHRHRVLGNIYEQILKMTPVRENGDLKLEIPDNGDDDQTNLGAHYTPIDLVQEVVRPTLGQLFRQYWEESESPRQYRRRVEQMTVVDPAMGSAHFLTVAALEIARELAWLDFFDRPRFEVLEDWDEPLLHENPIGADSETEDDSSEKGSEDGVEEGQAEDGRDAARVNEDRFYREEEHGEYVRDVRDELSGVIQRSIYGVDVNPLAAELGKLSLWLFEVGETDSDGSREEYPELTYLDANIRCGDSVVGVFLDDVEETVEDALRSGSFDGHQQTIMAMGNRSETIQEKLSRTRQYRRALSAAPKDFEDLDPGGLDPGLREELDLEGVRSGYELREQIDAALREHLSDLSWLFDLTLAVRYLGYTSGSGTAKATKLYRALHGEDPPGDSTSDIKPPIESAFQTLFESPDGEEALKYRRNLTDWLAEQDDLNAFHWEIEFPSVFERGGFEAVVTNPPFSGDKNLRKRLGDAALVDYLADYFIPQGNKSEYAGFFYWRYDQIANDASAVGTLGPNSIAQASNREYVMKPLTGTSPEDGVSGQFFIVRAVPNRDWPGEAKVHFAAIHFAREKVTSPSIVRKDFSSPGPTDRPSEITHNSGISSYLDEYPDFNLDELISPESGPKAYNGMYVRGNFFIHRQPEQSAFEAIQDVPADERDALAAYLNTRAVQQRPRPTPSDVIIDFYEPLRHAGLGEANSEIQLKWLESNYPSLLEQLRSRSPHAPDQRSVFEERQSLESSSDNDPNKKFWWLFGRVRGEMRHYWDGVSQVSLFPVVTKIWSPFRLSKRIEVPGSSVDRLRICPMHKLFIAPRFEEAHLAVSSSFLFEMFTRRRCGTLKSDLNFSPTDVFPYFPWPWDPQTEGEQLTIGEPSDRKKESFSKAIEKLLELRTGILENPESHGLTRGRVGGPTDLYNLYDADPKADDAPRGADSSAVEKLRQAHVDLLDAVLQAYGWGDIAGDLSREDWTFDRPWLDRTQRFAPPEPVRAKLFSRLDELNSERFELERDMMIDLIADHLPEEGLAKSNFGDEEPFSEMPIDGDQFETFMEHEQEKMGDSRVRKEGYRWYSIQ
jgi:hypothetical protein